MADADSTTLRGCPRCGLVQTVAFVPRGSVARCHRCHGPIHYGDGARRNELCAALAMSALVLYPLGVGLPVMRLEQLGHIKETSIWKGSFDLMAKGHWGIGLIVFVCSVVIPVLKLSGLFLLTSGKHNLREKQQAKIYRWIEIAGRWGMIDVLLVAITVAAVKLGDMVVVTPGPGVIAFALCVALSLIASAVFNPHAIWD